MTGKEDFLTLLVNEMNGTEKEVTDDVNKVNTEAVESNKEETSSSIIQIPHLDDPEKQTDILDKENKEIPDFTVRLGTSLTRKDTDLKARALLKKLAIPTQSLHPTSSLSSLGSNVRSRRTSVQRDRDRSLRYFSQALGKLSRSRRRTSLASTSELVCEESPTEPAEKPFKRFRRIALTVRLLARILLTLKSYVQEPDRSEWSFMEMYLHVRDDLNQKVAFNPHSYVKVEPKRDRLKRLLSIPKGNRTLDDVKMILSLMRDNSSFKDYPSHTQIQLAMCMEYQSYEARRVILRQGHIPSAFYILLSGSAIVNTRDCDPRTGKHFFRTVHEITAGNIFGEIALLESGRRTATVICKTSCELLVVQKEDFNEIIKEPLMRERADHINFCRELPVFTNFPCEVFGTHPSGFFFQYFRKGEVIVKDSRESKFLIVVAEGSCQLISDVKETAADRCHGPMFSKEMEDAFPLYTEMKKVKATARREKNDGSHDDSDSIGVHLLTGTLDKEKLIQQTQNRKELSRMGRRKSRHRLLVRSNTLGSFQDRGEDRREQLVSGDERCDAIKSNFRHDRRGGHAHPNGFRHSADAYRNRTHVDSSRQHLQSAMTPRGYSGGRVFTGEDRGFSLQNTESKTLHAQISELKQGSIFGLETLISRPTTTLSLVSDGAECILISKKLFLQEANIKVLRIVTDLAHNHPCHDYIKDQVYTYRKWQQYKMDTVLDVLDRHSAKELAIVGGVPEKKFPVPTLAYY